MEAHVIEVSKKAIYDAIIHELVGYNKPLSKFVDEVVMNHKTELLEIIDDGVSELINADYFKDAIKEALHDKLAKILINKTSGELEKKVNELKQNPITRAKISMALNQLMENVLNGGPK